MASVNLSYNERCKKLVSAVENISQNEMEEIFKMIHNYGCNYTRNNNGLFVNLTWIPEELLIKLEKYVNFCIVIISFNIGFSVFGLSYGFCICL